MEFTTNQSTTVNNVSTMNETWRIAIATVVCVFDLWILMANVFIISILARGARSRLNVTRKLLINLACSDLAIGIFVIPWAIATELLDWKALSASNFCHLGLALDIFFSTTSMYSLTVIAIDQFIGVCYALRYNQMLTDIRIVLLLSSPWFFSSLAALPMLGLSHWSLILRQPETLQIASMSSPSCTIHNTGILMRIYWTLIGFCLPSALVLYSHFKVCKRVIQNIRGLHAGFIEHKEELTRLKPATASKSSQNSTTRENKVSSMRVHIGGQPCYMKLNQPQTKNGGSEIFSHLPSTIKCGFLIVSATIPPNKNEKTEKVPNSSKEMSVNQSTGKSTAPLRNYSTQSLNKPRNSSGMFDDPNLTASQENEMGLMKRNSVDNQSASLLKPPKWLHSRSFSRKSDSEFASLRAMRRCALMPIQSRMHHSASTEITPRLENDLTVALNTPQIPAIRASANTIAVASFSDAPLSPPEPRLKRELKAVFQYFINCATIICGWIPFIVVHLLHGWLPSNCIPLIVLQWFYWIRFLCTAFNPLVCGSASEELRKAFRHFIYCGRPKQEKKALKRLVLAGLGAAGLSYGRPIVPVGIKKTTSNPDSNEV